MLPTKPLTVFFRPKDGTFQVEVTFTLEPDIIPTPGKARYRVKCNLHFTVSGKEADNPWEFTTEADGLTEDTIRDMYSQALVEIKNVKDYHLLEHYHKKYHTGFSMKLERAFGAALEAIAEKVQEVASGKAENKKAEPFTDMSFEGPDVPLA